MARPSSSPTSAAGEHTLPPGVRIACVSSTYHGELVGRMVDSARALLTERGLAEGHLEEHLVPGAFELPLAAQRLARRDDIDAVLAFGLVLKGETDHDRHIARAVVDALLRIGLETDTPVLLGLLTCPSLAHATHRALPAALGGLDKGREVALAATALLASPNQEAPPR